MAGKSDTSHTHDGRYYTESEVNNMLSAYAKRSSSDNFSTSANITAGTNLSGGNVSSSYDISAGQYLFGKSGCGETHVPAVMSRTSNQISLYWNGSGCYVFVDKVNIGKITTT